ncbi:MAG: BPL-N domain-containing protein [Bacteroidales bacterium]|nr:BPL-N domain-containing protein [Bacteroidales bacterium]
MKKLIYIPLALAALIFAASCQNEPDSTVEPAEDYGDFVISASFETPQSTKTSVDENGKVLWSDGDAFALITESTRDKFTLTSGAKTGSAEFTGTLTGAAPYYALYPYSEDSRIEDGAIKFKLPQTQIINTVGTFSQNSSPALASVADPWSPIQFKNLCGILEMNLCGSSVKVSVIELIDNSGQQLWGDCSVALDGKQGTDEQTMTVSGGSSCLKLEMPKAISLLASTPKSFCAVVPAGAFRNGFSARLYNSKGELVSVISTPNTQAKVSRSMFSSMTKYKITANISEPADTLARGYYKDAFMDGGVSLTGRTTLPAVTGLLGWSLEYLATSDQDIQDEIIIGDADDSNGALLYPDGEPRFRMIYVNGGQSNNHGKSLGAEGRNRIVTFVKNGGGYVGTCAGALIASKGYDSYSTTSEYLNIWPGHVYHTGMSDTYTDHTIMSGSPLLKYYNFGGDMQIDSVYHNGGCYMSENDYTPPTGTEILMRYKNANTKSEGKVSCWAYKPNAKEGRRVLIGSHPEGVTSGERRELFAAMARYATDGNGIAQAKATLSNGTERVMNKTLANYAPIGDGQYHFFLLKVPAGAKDITVELKSEYEGNLYLTMRKNGSAWLTEADFFAVNNGKTKSLHFDTLEEGTWSVGVHCPDKPTATLTNGRYLYSGNTEPVQGVEYSIKASWK